MKVKVEEVSSLQFDLGPHCGKEFETSYDVGVRIRRLQNQRIRWALPRILAEGELVSETE